MNETLTLLGRMSPLFTQDIADNEKVMTAMVNGGRFLVLGGAGTIGQAVVKEIFRRQPEKLHVVDHSENNLVELVRDIRSSFGYIPGDFQTFSLDVGSDVYDAFIRQDGQYDYVLNLSALKHVRSEKDPFTLMRMLDVNILNADKSLLHSIENRSSKYFCVSTDKATNPVNLMGASKRIMEMLLMRRSEQISVSTARFANVAFSDGSLLHGFNQRVLKHQPIVAPNDVKRYFVTAQESGELCLMSCLLGKTREIYFPKLTEQFGLVSFADIARRYLKKAGFEAYECEDEDEARAKVHELPAKNMWPCLFTASDTTGEKPFEEFFTDKENVDFSQFESIGVIASDLVFDNSCLDKFCDSLAQLKRQGCWGKEDLVTLMRSLLPELNYEEKGKYLDGKM